MFSWVQSKLRGKQETTKTSSGSTTSFIRPSTCGEEFSDWPNELLAIGTFGNINTPKQCDISTLQHSPSAVITTENDDIVEESSEESNIKEWTTCLENLHDHNFSKNDCRRLESMSLVEGRGQNNISLETNNNNSSIQKKSISYLFKKAFACSGGFSPKPSVFIDPLFPRDSLLFHETKFDTSRLEKIFRVILHKKVYPQGSSPRAALKKYLDSKDKKETESDDESDDGGKWVKTDAEYIVLEI
ncbi:hypothetical protein LIER_15987 [Lithospermum erythrorhizon]|uniref:Uncharacterized protein n=1 Tax=Lithospermum erythrorhizon TaxID=34254 RepID=A0AAV3Q7G4_LITER